MLFARVRRVVDRALTALRSWGGRYHIMGEPQTPALQAFSPLPDDHPCYGLVGQITAETARIELNLDYIIWETVGLLPVAGACITGQMVGMYPRYLALFQLADLVDMPKPILEEINKQKGKSAGLADLRNRAVHDAWFAEESEGAPHQHKGRTKLDTRFGPHPVSVDMLRDDLGKLRRHNQRVIKLQNQIRNWRVASRT